MAPTNHDVWDAVAQTDGTPGNSFEWLVAVKPAGGSNHVQSADISGVAPAFTAKNRNRETNAAKGVDSNNKYGETLVTTFNVEVIRDENGQYQPFLQDLVDASKGFNADNRRSLRVYDALGADYAFESLFGIQIAPTNTGWDDAGFFTVTATQYGKTTWIDNPVLVGNIPVLNGIDPKNAAAASHVFIQGANFFKDGVPDVSGAASVKFGATNATTYTVVSDTLIDATVPAGSAGNVDVKVTNSNGTTTYAGYPRGA